MAKKLSANDGFWYGLKMLSQVSGILVASALLGWGIDAWLGTGPLAFAGCVVVGSFAATGLVVAEAYKVLK